LTSHVHQPLPSNKLQQFSDESEQEIALLKNHIAKLQDRLEFSRLEVKLLRELGEATFQNSNLEETLNQVASTVYRMLNTESVLIAMYDPSLSTYTFVSGIGLGVDERIGTTHSLGQGINAWMVQNQSAWWHGVSDDFMSPNCTDWELNSESILMVPFVGQRQMLGSIACFNKGGNFNFTKQDFEFLSLLTQHISTTIEMMRLQVSHQELMQSLESRVLLRTEQLEQAKLEADRANEAKSMFLATMSHELRSPMNAILGYAQLMQEDADLPSKYRGLAAIIDRSGQHLLRLINDVLDASKIASGAMQLHLETFPLAELLSDISILFQHRCEQKKIDWIVRDQTDPNTLMFGDQAKLRRVLINLVGNAVKFTDRGSVTLEVSQHHGAMRFSVEDTGPGLDLSSIKDIFKPFQQVTFEKDRENGGTGLGLSIAQSLVELMGGHLEVQSCLGQGSQFYFSLASSEGTN